MFKFNLDRHGVGWFIFAWVITLLVNLGVLGAILWLDWHFISKYW